jgi:hypothetical protein
MYESPSELKADHDEQMVKGGLLVRGAPPAGLTLFDAVELEIGGRFAPLEQSPVVVRGQVVQMIAGVGVAVVFDPAPITAALSASESAPRPESPRARPAGNEMAHKIHLALHGNKDERMKVLRDTNKLLHQYVLRNPGIDLEDVLTIAKMRTVAPDLLVNIAGRKEWGQRPDVAIALVRNPTTPAQTAMRLVEYVSPAELRQLAKDTHTRPQVQQAARKKLFGGTT